MDSTLNIIENNLKFYDTIKPKNPSKSYSVIATLNDYETGKLLALATGTQANSRKYTDDIEDCHAESLLKRAYKRYLIDKLWIELTCAQTECESVLGTVQKCSQTLILFVSQFPCGLVERYEGQQPINEVTGLKIRRKPGRGSMKNGKMVYVEKDDCYTKLKKWSMIGLQGHKLGQTFGIRCMIKKIVIGNCEPNERFDYDSHLEKLRESLGSSLELEYVQNIRRHEFVFSPDKQPQPVALAWWAKSGDLGDPLGDSNRSERFKILGGYGELIVDGRKRGLTKVQCLKGGDSSQKLLIANHNLRRDLSAIEKLYKESPLSQLCRRFD